MALCVGGLLFGLGELVFLHAEASLEEVQRFLEEAKCLILAGLGATGLVADGFGKACHYLSRVEQKICVLLVNAHCILMRFERRLQKLNQRGRQVNEEPRLLRNVILNSGSVECEVKRLGRFGETVLVG